MSHLNCVDVALTRLCQIVRVDILPAMYPLVAWPAEGNDVVSIKPEMWVSRPRADGVGVECFTPCMPRTASNTAIAVSCIYPTNEVLPFGRSVKSLPFRGTAVYETGIIRPVSPVHPIPLASKIGLWYGRFLTKFFTGFRSMTSSFEGACHAGSLHVAILFFQVLPAWSSRDAEISQFLINPFRISPNNLRNFIGRKMLVKIFRTQPVRI